MTAAVENKTNGAVPAPAPAGPGDGIEDFDAFWAGYIETRRPKARIRGVEVTAPYDLPLELAERIEAADPADTELTHDLLTQLYGAGVVEAWKAAGMGGIELFVVLTWSYMRAGGSNATFADAMTTVMEAIEEGQLDAALNATTPVPNREEKRAAARKGGTRNGSSGARSSPTSGASTASRRKASPN